MVKDCAPTDQHSLFDFFFKWTRASCLETHGMDEQKITHTSTHTHTHTQNIIPVLSEKFIPSLSELISFQPDYLVFM